MAGEEEGFSSEIPQHLLVEISVYIATQYLKPK
jgi:hypothetical protein